MLTFCILMAAFGVTFAVTPELPSWLCAIFLAMYAIGVVFASITELRLRDRIEKLERQVNKKENEQ